MYVSLIYILDSYNILFLGWGHNSIVGGGSQYNWHIAI